MQKMKEVTKAEIGAMGLVIFSVSIGLIIWWVKSYDDRWEIQGTWIAVMHESLGVPQSVQHDGVTTTITINNDEFTVRGPYRHDVVGKITLDPQRKAIDLRGCNNPQDYPLRKDEVDGGLYRLEGKRLVLCTAKPGGPRPKSLESTPENHCDLLVLERQ